MIVYRNNEDKEDALLRKVKAYISRLGYYVKPNGGIPASDLAGWVLPSAVTDKAVGNLGYTKNEGTVTGAKVNNVMIEDEDGVLDIGTVVTDVSGKADIASPTFTGVPKAPTPSVGTNNTQIATTAFVTTAVADAIAGVTGIEYTIVASLPATGEAGVIYLISNSGSGQNIYDEYIWVNNAFEKIGTTEIDLSGYSTTAEIEAMLDEKQDVIDDLATIRSGAALGATALQSYTETDPTVPAWAKAAQKPSYSYSEITNTPTLATVATSGSYNDLSNKPTIPAEQIQADWNQSNSSAKDYIKNKPTIPVVPTLADVATSGDYEDLINTPTVPTVPTNVSAFTNDAGYLTQHQDISGKANTADLAAVATSGSYTDLDDKPTIPTVPTNVSAFTNDAGYITGYTETDPTVPSWAKAASKPSYTAAEVGALPDTTAIPTESTVSGWGFTKNTGTVTSTNNAVTNIAVVSALPASPDANTLYLITGS